jgi:predicted kinase
MNTLIMTVGLPRSGKSTWAKKQNLPIVNPDSTRLALHGQRFTGAAEPMVWAIAHYMVESLFLAGHAIVILDATNTTKARRDEWKSKKWIRTYCISNTPIEVCIERATARR